MSWSEHFLLHKCAALKLWKCRCFIRKPECFNTHILLTNIAFYLAPSPVILSTPGCGVRLHCYQIAFLFLRKSLLVLKYGTRYYIVIRGRGEVCILLWGFFIPSVKFSFVLHLLFLSHSTVFGESLWEKEGAQVSLPRLKNVASSYFCSHKTAM